MNPTGVRYGFAKFFFLLVLLADFGVSARAQETVMTQNGLKVEIPVTKSRDWVLVGQSLSFYLNIRNLSDRKLIWRAQPRLEPTGRTTVRILQPDGTPLAVKGFVNDIQNIAINFTIQPGETFQRGFSLPYETTFQTVGLHTIIVETTFPFSQDETSPVIPIRITASIQADVHRRGSEKLGKIIEQFESDMLDGTPAAAAKAGNALAQINDPRVGEVFLRFLERCATQVGEFERLPLRLSTNVDHVTSAFVDDERYRRLFPPDRTNAALRLMKNSPAPEIRASFTSMIGNDYSPDRFPVLFEMRKDASALVRVRVAVGLEYNEHPDAEKTLVEMTTDPDPKIQGAAAHALARRKAEHPR